MCVTAACQVSEKMSSSKSKRDMKKLRHNSLDPLLRLKIPTILILKDNKMWDGRLFQNGEQADQGFIFKSEEYGQKENPQAATHISGCASRALKGQNPVHITVLFVYPHLESFLPILHLQTGFRKNITCEHMLHNFIVES